VYKEKLSKIKNYTRREKFMTDDELKMIDDYICTIIQNRADMGDLYSRWEKEEEAYKGDQAEIPDRPNSRVNIINNTFILNPVLFKHRFV
jgi:hypothetical protein